MSSTRRHDVITFAAITMSLVFLCGYMIAAVFEVLFPFRFEPSSNATGNGTAAGELPPWLLRVKR